MAKQLILHIGSQNEDGDYYAALDGSKEVHVVSGDTIKELIEKKAADFTDNTILSGSLNQPVMRPSVLLSSGKMIPRQPYHLQSMTAASIWQKSTVRPENW